MAENIDRHRNSVINLEYTFSQRLGRHSRHLVVGGQSNLATYRQAKDSLTITTFDLRNGWIAFRTLFPLFRSLTSRLTRNE
jgi:hypothetical protein